MTFLGNRFGDFASGGSVVRPLQDVEPYPRGVEDGSPEYVPTPT